MAASQLAETAATQDTAVQGGGTFPAVLLQQNQILRIIRQGNFHACFGDRA